MRIQRSLIACAALIAFSGAASAQMSIYGLADVCYGRSLLSDVFLLEKADVHSGGDNSSSECNSTTRVGIKGSTDVGSGVKMNFKFETAGIKSNGQVGEDGQAFFRRQAWLGMSGSLGEVRVGRQDSVPFQVMGDFDFNGQSNGVSAAGYAFVAAWLPGRQSRSIQYIAPAMGGLSAQFGLKVKGSESNQLVDGNKDVFSGALKYSAGPLLVGASFQSKTDSSIKDDFFSIAGSWDFGVAKVMASYADGGEFLEGGTGKGYVLGVVAPVAGFSIGAHYANNSDDGLKIKAWELFINREVFKNTYAYLEGGNWKTSLSTNPLDPAARTKGSGYALGMIYVF